MGLIGRSENKKRHKEKHKRLGLCVHCSREVVKGRVRCNYHLAYATFMKKYKLIFK